MLIMSNQLSIYVKKLQVAWRVTRDSNGVQVVTLFKWDISWGPVISPLAGNRGITNGKVALIYFLKTCSWKIYFLQIGAETCHSM